MAASPQAPRTFLCWDELGQSPGSKASDAACRAMLGRRKQINFIPPSEPGGKIRAPHEF